MVLVKDSQTVIPYHQALIMWLSFCFLILEMGIKTQNKTSCIIVKMKWRVYEKYFVGYKALSDMKLRNSGGVYIFISFLVPKEFMVPDVGYYFSFIIRIQR